MALCGYVKDRAEQYVWADVCCIDKTSSSELQEAINSMYRWYQHAVVCLVYLEDVDRAEDDVSPEEQFARSQWWTRGWTLQELLAPTSQIFLDCNWKAIGSRCELAEAIERITAIPAKCLGDAKAIQATPVCQRMSWMSTRQTTVMEDLAYCMLGIFDINMTMLYGEGAKAFLRLQAEILQVIDDETMFLWTSTPAVDLRTSTILAPSPACFKGLADSPYRVNTYFSREPFRLTARGLAFEVYGSRSSIMFDDIQVPLNCLDKDNDQRPHIHLRRSYDHERGVEQWHRVAHESIGTLENQAYPSVESDQESYLRRKQALQMDAHRSFGGTGLPASSVRFQAMFEFDNENVRRKIFVR